MTPMTNIEKMMAGETYNFNDPELEVIRKKARDLLWRFNSCPDASERRSILGELLGGMGQGAMIEPPFHCNYGRNIHIGEHAYLNFSCNIVDCNEVRIGRNVMIGPAVQIFTAAHALQAEARIQGWEVAKPVVVEDNVWLGGGTILLPGVRVGRNAVVGAGAVVTRDVPADTVVAGNPARVIRELE